MPYELEVPVQENKENDILFKEKVFDYITKGAGGYVLNGFAAVVSTFTDSQTIYFGGSPANTVSTTAQHFIYVPRTGFIRSVVVWGAFGTAGSNEGWAASVRINDTTDYAISTTSTSSTSRTWANENLKIPVYAGNTVIIKLVNPAWATNPANGRFGCSIFIG